MVEPDRPEMTWCMCFACQITKARRDTQSEYEYVLLSHGNNDYVNIPTLPVLFYFYVVNFLQ
jgi:hypothetical protein